MNMDHVIKVNNRIHQISQVTNNGVILNSGKQWANVNFNTRKMVQKHCLTGRFMSTKAKTPRGEIMRKVKAQKLVVEDIIMAIGATVVLAGISLIGQAVAAGLM